MKTCIECNSPTRNKRSSLCQSCFDKALEKKIEEVRKIDNEHASNSWF